MIHTTKCACIKYVCILTFISTCKMHKVALRISRALSPRYRFLDDSMQ